MWSWLFKKRAGTAPRPASPIVAAAPAPLAAPRPTPEEKAEAARAARAQGQALLDAALGDDAALLRLAASAPTLDIRIAAVQAITAEESLRQAERDLRDHDRKVHRLAKQRLEAALAQRKSRAQAQALLDRASALLGEPEPAINLVVALDQEWAQLRPELLEPGQAERFAALRAQVDAAIRHSDERRRQLRGWVEDARRVLLDWKERVRETAEQGLAADLSAPQRTLATLADARPEGAAGDELGESLARAARLSGLVAGRLAWIESRLGERAAAPARDEEPGPEPEPGTEPAPEPAATPAPAPAWSELPPLDDPDLARILDQRHQRELPPPPRVEAPAVEAERAPARPPRAARREALDEERRTHLESILGRAEAALAEGHSGEVQQQLQVFESALAPAQLPLLPEALRARLQALKAEAASWKGWQAWGGARARDGLIAEAEALAKATPVAEEGVEPPAGEKVNVKARSEQIQALRARWKELDHMGASTGTEPWRRFDAALQTAYTPIAAHRAAIEAVRKANLGERLALLATLDGLALPGDSPQDRPAAPAAPAAETAPADAPATDAAQDMPAADAAAARPATDWKSVIRALDEFQLAWRKLGPIEHTVPAEDRRELQQRWRASLDRIETPLRAVRGEAASTREQLIESARTLAADTRMPAGERARRARDLQAAWRDHARGLPLQRTVEAELWSRFKAATDEVFAQREAACAAQASEIAAIQGASEALLERLAGLTAETPVAEIERTLAEVDRAWRQAPELPRGLEAEFERRFVAARAAAVQHLSAGGQLRWEAQCDALATALALCESRERGDESGAELEQRWQALGPLPKRWHKALAQRWSGPPATDPQAGAAIDDALLQIEAALRIPAPAERQADLRDFKLRQLKAALEARSTSGPTPADPAECLEALLRQGGSNAAQSERLQIVLAALRRARPGSLTG